MIEQYKEWLKLNVQASNTKRLYFDYAQEFLKFSNNQEITQDIVNKYFTNKLETGLGDSSFNYLRFAIKKFLTFLNLNLIIPPKRKVAKKKALAKGYLTEQQFKNDLIKNINYIFSSDKVSEFEMAFKILFYGGLRPDEVINLKVSNINFEEDLIYIVDGKGNKDREIFFTDNLFKKQLKEFCNSKKEYVIELTYSQILNGVKKAGHEISFKQNLTPRTFRRSFAIFCMSNPVIKESHIQSMLGHEDLETTQLYMEPTRESIKEACRMLRERK